MTIQWFFHRLWETSSYIIFKMAIYFGWTVINSECIGIFFLRDSKIAVKRIFRRTLKVWLWLVMSDESILFVRFILRQTLFSDYSRNQIDFYLMFFHYSWCKLEKLLIKKILVSEMLINNFYKPLLKIFTFFAWKPILFISQACYHFQNLRDNCNIDVSNRSIIT